MTNSAYISMSYSTVSMKSGLEGRNNRVLDAEGGNQGEVSQ